MILVKEKRKGRITYLVLTNKFTAYYFTEMAAEEIHVKLTQNRE